MSKQKACGKTLIIADDEEAEADEADLNPFSYREFLRWKNLEPTDRQEEEEEDEGWERSCQSATADSTSSLCTEEEEEETRFSSQPEARQGGGGGGGGGGAGGEGENYEGDDETSMAEPLASCRKRSSRSSQLQQLKEENVVLRRTIRELQKKLDTNEQRVGQLSEELVQRRRQEEKEAQDLESMVHSVEQNLHLMTKRALKAESSVSKLKLELQQLQGQAEAYRLENECLKAAESEVVMTMRHNAQLASEYLQKSASLARSSVRCWERPRPSLWSLSCCSPSTRYPT
ncbi:endosome-associated-trafficking regulator 1 isoform X2 [Myripristis murdjan]|uniref:endosome-associated-trafficking regulator 1 isoform X2 n=1 Tax=Myripristis murdjan TaxID=586833 RepID=UPI001175DB36|nr:endosome-associated-trafficking regulator 1 isoform X2 [Myripristis murdjan]